MGKPSAPEPTPPRETAAAQNSTSIGTAVANSYLNNVNQITPDGSLTFDRTGTYKLRDSYTGQTYDIPTWTATQSLSPNQQAIKDETDAAELNLATTAKNQSSLLNDTLGKPIDLSRENIDRYISDHYLDDFDRDQDRRLEALKSELSNSGIKLGSEAYDRAMEGYNRSRSDARDNLYGNMTGLAQQSIVTARNQPVSETVSLLYGSQPNQPNFVGTQQPRIPTTDVAGIISNYDNQRANNYRFEAQQRQGMLGGLFGLGAAGIRAISDERLKKDIEKVGKVKGHNVYEYRFRGQDKDDPKEIGVMAQEVEKRRPDAVVTGSDGIKRVKYGSLFGARG